MKNTFAKLWFSLVILLSSLLISNKVEGQFAITGVSYKLKYNIDSCHYEVLLIIDNGFATTLIERLQLNANISVVLPITSELIFKRSYFPKSAITGNIPPNYWLLSASIDNPAAAPGKKFRGFTPFLASGNGPYAYPNPLQKGDTIRLFSFTVDNVQNCSKDIRLFINGVDPGPNAPGMSGLDFNQGFTIQDPSNQTFNSVANQEFPPLPIINDISVSCRNGIEIDLTTSVKNNNACQTPLSYAWTGPNSFIQNGTGSAFEDVNISPAIFATQGTYKVVITDRFGCKDSTTIDAFNKPDAGPDQTVSSGSIANIQGTEPNTGTWSQINSPTNPPGATIIPGSSGAAQVSFSSSAFGKYFFVYSTSTCQDTMMITVDKSPVVGFNATPFICANGGTIGLIANQPGTWVSNNPIIATVSGSTVTGLAPGIVTFTFTSSTTGYQSTTAPLTVEPKPVVSLITSSICTDGITLLSPSTGGTWTAVNPSIASVNTAGQVIGLSAGLAKFYFRINTGAQCTSDTLSITVLPKPVTILLTPSICVGDIGTIKTESNVPGVWQSLSPSVAVINNSGRITGISPGTASFQFTEIITGCRSDASTPVNVYNKPVITSSKSQIEIGESTNLSSNNTTGTWSLVNQNPQPLDLKLNPLSVTGINKGTGIVVFTSEGNCTDTLFINVSAKAFRLSGLCFTDLNGNNIYDSSTDFVLPNVAITDDNSTTTYYTNADGYYSFVLDSGINNVTYNVGFGNWVTNPITKTINIKNTNNFSFVGFQGVNNSQVSATSSLSSPPFECNEEINLYAQAINTSSKLLNGYLIIDFDEKSSTVLTNPLPSGGQDNYLVWPFNRLAPGKVYSPEIKIKVPNQNLPNDSMTFKILVVNSDTNDTLSKNVYKAPILCMGNKIESFTSNLPNRDGDDNYTLPSEEISYRIDFTNTLSTNANTIEIINNIDENLILSSLKITKASHPFDVYSKDKKLYFYADSINLSGTTRENGNKGFVTFTIKPKPNLANRTVIKHSAEIKLSNGLNSITEEVINTIINELPCDLINDEIIQNANTLTAPSGNTYEWYKCNSTELLSTSNTFSPQENGSYFVVVKGNNCTTTTACFNFVKVNTTENSLENVVVFPNPANDKIYISSEANLEINIYDMYGKKVLTSKEKMINIDGLINGVYGVQLSDGKSSVVKKIIVSRQY